MGDTTVYVHGALMGIAWMIFAPAAMYSARYLKSALGVWWFRLHIFVSVMVVVLTLTAAIIAWTTFDEIPYQDPHVILGLIVFIWMFLQVILGAVIDRLFKPGRERIPWWDVLHWWSGRVLIVVAWATIPVGFSLYSDPRPPSTIRGSYIAWGVGVFVLIVVFIVSEYFLGPVRHPKDAFSLKAGSHAQPRENA